MSLDQFLLSASTTDLNYPEIRPSLDLNFARTKTLDPRITFTRSSGGSYTGSDGLVKYAGVNEARFDHDPITGESLGLLIEEARTNYETNGSDNLFNMQYSNWVSDNSITYPDGRTIGGYNIFDQLSGPRFFLDFNPGPGNTTYTCSVYARLKTGSTVTQCFIFVKDIVSDTVRGFSGYVTLTNQWQRITATGTTAGATAGLRFEIYVDASGARAQAYFWGAQVEVGSFPTSYIPTVASARTRAADSAEIVGTNFLNWYNQTEGTFFINCTLPFISNDTSNRVAFGVSNGFNFSDSIYLGKDSSSLIIGFNMFYNNVSQTTGGGSANMTSSNIKFATSVAPRSNYVSFYGGIINTATATTRIPNATRLTLGREPWNFGGTFNTIIGCIKNFTYYPKALPNSQLQVLTR